jgi:Terminase large subunit, T4likevirus-type, N-terminal
MWSIEERPDGAEKREARRAERFRPSDWLRRELGFEPDAAQERVIDSAGRRLALNCTRQWGKSTVTAAKAVYQAQTTPGSLTLVVSPSARQSGELVRKAEAFARKLKIRPKGDGDNEISLAFPNGSRLVGLPGNEATVRGFSAVSLLAIDEASRVSDDLYLALRPMLAVSAGTLWLMSTPYGKRGFFHEVWEHGGSEWERVRVPASECARIPGTFLEEERKSMGERWFRQEYLCEFVDSVSGVFDRDLVESAITAEVQPLEID